jgi:hypothetical protein
MPALITEYASRKNHFSSAEVQFDFDFYDLEIIPGLYANGTAEIAVHADGVNDDPEFFIGRIFLHGEQNKPKEIEGDPSLVTELERQIFLAIYDRLENDSMWSDKIEDRVASALREMA